MRGIARCSPIWSCSRWGFPCRGRLPVARCALTAPFHPCLSPKAIGGVFSVALSVGSRPPGVTWHLVLRSPDFPLRMRSDCPADSSGNDTVSGCVGREDAQRNHRRIDHYQSEPGIHGRAIRPLKNTAGLRPWRPESRLTAAGKLQGALIQLVLAEPGYAGRDFRGLAYRHQLQQWP